MPALNASIGISQLKRINIILKKKEKYSFFIKKKVYEFKIHKSKRNKKSE